MEKPIKQLFIDFIEDKCSEQEILQVQQYLKEDLHHQEWREAIDEVEARLLSNDYSQIRIDEEQLFSRVQKSAGISSDSYDAGKNIKSFGNPMSGSANGSDGVNQSRRNAGKGQFNTFKNYTWIGYAAAFLIILAAGFFLNKPARQSTAPQLSQIKTTPAAAKKDTHKWIKLPDGSSVQLNNDSHLDYPESFAGNNTREVTLTGEAYFDVKHDQKHPFIIHTGKIRTTVLGTAFNISAYKASSGVVVTVTRGKVMVQDGKKTLAILIPNQQFAWNNNSQAVKADVNAEKITAWKNTDIIMDDITLADAAQIITERYGMKVRFSNDKVKNCRFTAAFLNSNEIGQVLHVLSDITGASLTLKNNSITIDGPGC